MVKHILLVVCALILSSVAFAQGANLAASTPQADSGLGFAVGTLAGIGSFEFEAAPLYTAVAMKRHNAAVALRNGTMSVQQATLVQAQADQVRSYLDTALALCKQDQRTGKCTRMAVKAHRYLVKAQAALSKIQDSP